MPEIKELEFNEELLAELSHGTCKKIKFLKKNTLTSLSF